MTSYSKEFNNDILNSDDIADEYNHDISIYKLFPCYYQ